MRYPIACRKQVPAYVGIRRPGGTGKGIASGNAHIPGPVALVLQLEQMIGQRLDTEFCRDVAGVEPAVGQYAVGSAQIACFGIRSAQVQKPFLGTGTDRGMVGKKPVDRGKTRDHISGNIRF